MAEYEAMLIFKSSLSEDQQKGLVNEVENILKQNQAIISGSESFGKRSLAYEIKRQGEGLYHLINFSSSAPAVVSRLKHACNINENILRTLITKK